MRSCSSTATFLWNWQLDDLQTMNHADLELMKPDQLSAIEPLSVLRVNHSQVRRDYDPWQLRMMYHCQET